MIAIIPKKAATQIIATAFSCSGVGSVMPIASMIPFVSETSILMIMVLCSHRPHSPRYSIIPHPQ